MADAKTKSEGEAANEVAPNSYVEKGKTILKMMQEAFDSNARKHGTNAISFVEIYRTQIVEIPKKFGTPGKALRTVTATQMQKILLVVGITNKDEAVKCITAAGGLAISGGGIVAAASSPVTWAAVIPATLFAIDAYDMTRACFIDSKVVKHALGLSMPEEPKPKK